MESAATVRCDCCRSTRTVFTNVRTKKQFLLRVHCLECSKRVLFKYTSNDYERLVLE